MCFFHVFNKIIVADMFHTFENTILICEIVLIKKVSKLLSIHIIIIKYIYRMVSLMEKLPYEIYMNIIKFSGHPVAERF